MNRFDCTMPVHAVVHLAVALSLSGCAAGTAPEDTEPEDLDLEEEPIGTAHSAVSAGAGQQVWGVTSVGRIWRLTDGEWKLIPGSLKQISAGGTQVWGVNSAGSIFRWNGSGWDGISGALVQVSVGADDSVWGVNSAGNIFRWNGSGWDGISGALTKISVGSAHHVWGVNSAGSIFRWNGSGWDGISGALVQVSVAADGSVWGVNSAGSIFRRQNNSWVQVSGTLKEVSVASASAVWGVNSSGQLFRWNNTSWDQVSYGLSSISAHIPVVASFFESGLSSDMVLPPIAYGRGVGVPLNTCDAGSELQAGLCYPNCASGYAGVGPVCWQICPSGYKDTGAFCTYDSWLTRDCIGWDGLTCLCPANYSNAGLFCAANTIAKASYGRGAGTVPHCAPDEELDGALCYPPCQEGYNGVGPVCWISDVLGAVCDRLYSPTLASAAQSANLSMTYGIGAGVAIGATLAVETGVVYGRGGEFGCYYSWCGGLTSDASISAWGSVAVLNLPFDQVQGKSLIVNQGAGAIVGLTTGQILDMAGNLVGTMDAITLGVGLSKIPLTMGYVTCETTVQQRW